MSPVCVYALLGAAPVGPLPTGVSGEVMRVIDCGKVLAAVGDVAEAPPLVAEALRGHDAAVRALGEIAGAVLPARFGSLLADDDAVRAFVRRDSGALRRALELVDGCLQMTLRVYAHGDLGPERPPRPAAEPGAGPGARYLRGRAAARPEARDLPALARVLAALEATVRAEKVEDHDHPPLLASVYHLVERARLAEYGRRLEGAVTAEAAVLTVKSSGPWPAYAFAPEATP